LNPDFKCYKLKIALLNKQKLNPNFFKNDVECEKLNEKNNLELDPSDPRGSGSMKTSSNNGLYEI